MAAGLLDLFGLTDGGTVGEAGQEFTASLLLREVAARPCHWRPKGPVHRKPGLLPAVSSFRFHESEPRSGMSGEALPASQRQPLGLQTAHSSDGSGGLAGLSFAENRAGCSGDSHW